MVKFIKNFSSYVNIFTTRFFFYALNSVGFILVFLNTAWVYLLFVSLLFLLILKFYMGFVLSSHIVGKFIFICIFSINSLPYVKFLFRDFTLSLFSWSEACMFLIFSIQVLIMLIASSYDFFQYNTFHRYGIPCEYFAERVDTLFETLLLSFFKFFFC